MMGTCKEAVMHAVNQAMHLWCNVRLATAQSFAMLLLTRPHKAEPTGGLPVRPPQPHPPDR